MDQLLHDRREEILKIAANHGATDVRLFGSRPGAMREEPATLTCWCDWLQAVPCWI